MAKEGVKGITDLSSMAAEKVVELKNELQRLVKVIVDDDDYTAEDEAVRILGFLKEFKLKKSSFFNMDENHITVPEEFKCPISKELMRDPVILATGLTYDRQFIERWLSESHRTCPQTQQVLTHTVLTPNHLVQEMISQWCTEHGIEPPKPTQDVDGRMDKMIKEMDGDYINSLLEKFSSSLSDQKEAAEAIRLQSKQYPSFRQTFCKHTDGIAKLLSPLFPGQANSHPDMQEDIITSLLNLSIDEKNKGLVGENQLAISLLVESLTSGTTKTKSNAAAALFTLSDLDSNKSFIGNLGALKPLIDLLDEDDPQVMKDAASAIFSLCILQENKRRAIQDGAVPMIVKKMKDNVMVEELLSIIALLSVHQKAVDDMNELNAVPLLLSIIRSSTCEKSKENCIAILYTICYNDRVKLKELKVEEQNNGTISKLSRTGTARAKRKASNILERLNKAALMTHTA